MVPNEIRVVPYKFNGTISARKRQPMVKGPGGTKAQCPYLTSCSGRENMVLCRETILLSALIPLMRI